MRQRDRDRVGAQARELCAEADPEIAKRLSVIWCRELPGLYGLAYVHRPLRGHVVDPECDVFVCETRWRVSSEDDRADTIAHEVAHVVAWTRNPDSPAHGSAWRRCFKKLRAIAVEMEW